MNNNIEDSIFIIPFSCNKKQIVNKYKKFWLKNIFLHDSLKKRKYLKKIEPAYVKTYVYDVTVKGVLDLKSKKITKWKNKTYQYQKNDSYNVSRDFSINFNSYPIFSMEKINLLKYNYNNRQIIKDDISGYKIFDKFNDEESFNKLKNKLELEINKIVLNSLKEYNENVINNINMNYTLNNYYIVYLPIWILTIKYKNKKEEILINGDNFEVEGKFVFNKLKIVFLWFIFFIFFLVIVFCFFYYMVNK